MSIISGDVIYASKPLIQSFGVALINKIKTSKAVVLDIDDWELGFSKEYYDSMPWLKKIIKFLRSPLNLGSYSYLLLMNKLIRFADVVTVSGNVLLSMYGGTLICHGRNIDQLDPQKFCRSELKKIYLPEKNNDAFVISFIGTLRPHKGLDDLIDALSLLKHKGFLLMIVGIEDGDYVRSLKNRIRNSGLSENVKYFPQQPFEKLPEFLSFTDLVVIPQRKRSSSYGQVPAKIFDAMAMAKPIISTDIPDISEILDGCGWIVEPENPKKLAEAIQYVRNNPKEAEEISLKARQKCIDKYSWTAMEKELVKVFKKYE